MKIKSLAVRIHEDNIKAGWYDSPRTALEYHMLIVSELAEATETVRKGQPDYWHNNEGKPEGEAVECTDALIRLLDYMQYRKWPIESLILEKLEYNRTRGYRHGGKKL